jgi:16S rRNA (uracil1498-N3)-methyltransferase
MALPPDAAHHLAHVLRVRVGDAVQVFDGRGRAADAIVAEATAAGVVVRVNRVVNHPDAGRRVILFQALPKGGLMDWIVEKATEIGVDRIQPVAADRSVARVAADRSPERVARWRRIAAAAARQCGSSFVPEVGAPVGLSAALSACGPLDLLLVCCLRADAVPLAEALGAGAARRGTVAVMIGPEGDWSPTEIDQAVAAGGRAVSFGPRVFRVETAAIYALSVLAHEAEHASANGRETPIS